MSDEYRRIELITGSARRRRWSAEQKLRMVKETLRSDESISIIARRHGVAPNLLYRWRRLMKAAEAAPRLVDAFGGDHACAGSFGRLSWFCRSGNRSLRPPARVWPYAPWFANGELPAT